MSATWNNACILSRFGPCYLDLYLIIHAQVKWMNHKLHYNYLRINWENSTGRVVQGQYWLLEHRGGQESHVITFQLGRLFCNTHKIWPPGVVRFQSIWRFLTCKGQFCYYEYTYLGRWTSLAFHPLVPRLPISVNQVEAHNLVPTYWRESLQRKPFKVNGSNSISWIPRYLGT